MIPSKIGVETSDVGQYSATISSFVCCLCIEKSTLKITCKAGLLKDLELVLFSINSHLLVAYMICIQKITRFGYRRFLNDSIVKNVSKQQNMQILYSVNFNGMKVRRVRDYNAKTCILKIHVIMSCIFDSLCEPMQQAPLTANAAGCERGANPKAI